MTAPLTTLVRAEPLFTRVLIADLISKTGDGAHELAFVLLALAVTQGNLQWVGWIYFLRFVPYFVAGPLGGRLADVMDARRVMLGCDVARGAITAVLAGAIACDGLGPLGLALAGCAMTTFRTLFQPAFQASVPRLVMQRHLVAANGMTQISVEVGAAAGPALAGLLLWGGSLTWVVAFDALTYVVACWILWRIPRGARARFAPAPTPDEANEAVVASWRLRVGRAWTSWWVACRDIARSPALFSAIVMSSVCILFVGAALRVMIPAWAMQVGETTGAAALVASVIAAGTIAGAAVFARRPRRIGPIKLLGYWSIYGGFLALMPLTDKLPWLLSIAFAMGISGACVDVVLATLIQRYSPPQRIGTHFSVFSTLANAGEAFSGLLAGLLVGIGSLSGGLVCNGLLVIGACAVGALSVARRESRGREVIDA
ncbi:MFS transporter [Pandoraea soli]|uniref:Bacilysin exporter BacE n=1 Tax=Pandoraea soli TaxID=2508293 RepID=A0ABY6VX16_9BURK|nr:MFS transporter [Pandoraea soli]VVD96389.1 Putative bacilysin exporter BacE [Pandoraea soli]